MTGVAAARTTGTAGAAASSRGNSGCRGGGRDRTNTTRDKSVVLNLLRGHEYVYLRGGNVGGAYGDFARANSHGCSLEGCVCVSAIGGRVDSAVKQISPCKVTTNGKLTNPTMPVPQCVGALQKNQMATKNLGPEGGTQ